MMTGEAIFIDVDDFRIVLQSLKKEARICDQCQMVTFNLDQFREDNRSQETDKVWTARIKMLPTLDFEMWMEGVKKGVGGGVNH